MRKERARMFWLLALLLCAAMGELIKFGFFDGEAHWHQIRYFTNLSNLLAGGYALLKLCRPRIAIPALRGLAVLAMSVTALVYHVMLSSVFGGYEPFGMGWWGNLLVHTLTPALMVGEWLLFRDERALNRRHPLIWVSFPAAYFGATVCMAQLGMVMPNSDTPYPYPFLDVWKLGWAVVLRNVLLMGVGFLALGYALVGVDCLRRRILSDKL